MDNYPGDGEFLDPSAFDADAFLAASQREAAQFEEIAQSMEAADMAAESEVVNALERVGFPVDPIRSAQANIAPESGLLRTIDGLTIMQSRLLIEREIDQALQIQRLITVISAVGRIAIRKQLTDTLDAEMQSPHKIEQQVTIYADPDLLQIDKESLLAAIEELYPGIDGLDPTSPDTIIAIQEEVNEQKISEEVFLKSHALRGLVDTELRGAIASLGLGQHDHLEDMIAALNVCLTRAHVIAKSGYDDELRKSAEVSTGITLRQSLRAATAMGWSEGQFEAVLQRVRDRLNEAESE